MIRAFSRSNRPEKSLQFYIDMLESGCSGDSYTFPFLLKSCSHLSAFSEGQQIHTHVVKSGLSADSFVANSLIRMYAECGRIEFAGLVYEKMPVGERNQVSWASMIAGFVDKNRPKEALALFMAEDWRKLEVDQITLATVLSACGRDGDLDLGREIHHYIEEEKIEMGLILHNSLMSMYMKCGCVETACGLFMDMPDKDSVSWNVLISGFSENGHLENGLKVFREMKLSNVRVNEATFLSLISSCDRLDLGLMIHNHVREMGLQWKVCICNALITMYSRIGRVDIARKLFDEMPERNIISWNSIVAGYAESGLMESASLLFDQMSEKDNFSWSTMILGYVKQGQSDKAMKTYKKLQGDGTKPDKVTIISVLSVCSHLGALEEGTTIHQYLEKTEMQIDASLATALIAMNAKCGCLEKAMEIFKGQSEKDVCTWTALISGLAIHGRAEEALHLFRQMQHVGGESNRPNSITFLSVLSACSHAGLVEEGQQVYNIMLTVYGIEPTMEHKGCMVDLLGRAGLLNEAAEFIGRLGSEVDASVWGALLGACRIHGNVELGEYATKKILELEPMHHGAYVLMSNIYAEAGRWNDSKRMRKKMKDEEISKEVGRSWIEVNGIRHEFAAGDLFHTGSDNQ